MQLLNNFQENVGWSRNKKIIFIVSGVLILVVVFLLIIFLNSNSKKNSGFYYDPASKETIDDSPDKTPETLEDNVANEPVFLGFGKLSDYGISQDQLSNIKSAFNTYLGNGNNGKKEVSVYVDSVVSNPIDRETGSNPSISFDVLIQREKKLSAVVTYSGVSDIQLKLYQGTSLVFDSGVITNTTNPNDPDLID